jgi:hypothetical protein
MNQNTWVDRLAHRSRSINHILIDIENMTSFTMVEDGQAKPSDMLF